MRGTRALVAAAVVMGVLIVVGVATLAVLIVQRTTAAPAAPARILLQEPPGTRVTATSLGPEHLSVQLSGGGPDRVVVLDLRTGRIAATITLPP